MTFKDAIKATPTDSLEAWLVQYEDFVAQTRTELLSRRAKAAMSLKPEAVPPATLKG